MERPGRRRQAGEEAGRRGRDGRDQREDKELGSRLGWNKQARRHKGGDTLGNTVDKNKTVR